MRKGGLSFQVFAKPSNREKSQTRCNSSTGSALANILSNLPPHKSHSEARMQKRDIPRGAYINWVDLKFHIHLLEDLRVIRLQCPGLALCTETRCSGAHMGRGRCQHLASGVASWQPMTTRRISGPDRQKAAAMVGGVPAVLGSSTAPRRCWCW